MALMSDHRRNGVFLLQLCSLVILFAQRSIADDRPNVLMIFTDDQGVNDVGCYGSEIPTPRIDQLATEGVRLTQFYAASSICTPSRFGLFTGRYPHRSRDQLLSALMFLTEEDAKRGIRQGEQTYVSLLQDAGYSTALVGKWHLGHGSEQFWPTRHGFDSFFGHTGGCVDFFTLHYGNRPDWYRGRDIVETEGYATDVITDEALSILRDHAMHEPVTRKPLYLHLSYNAPHFGKGWNEASGATENVMQPKQADLEHVSQIKDPLRQSFAAKVVGLDDSIGRVLDELDRQGLADNTIVIFMTDHGGDPDYGGSNLPLRGDKATLFEGGLRVPCIVRWPQHIPAATQCDAVACAIDWFPTLCEIAGVAFPNESLDGQSILQSLTSCSTDQPNRTLVWRTGSHAELGRKSWYAIRQGDWKWVQPPEQSGMLFDLSHDPNEQHDVADRHPDVASQLEQAAKR
tara:strand:+ start:1071011 stop:1072384 length:1374 start_codon:yes stop_codon:yes gene_type:complete